MLGTAALPVTRRGFLSSAAALSAASVFPRWLIAEAQTTQRVLVRADAEIGLVTMCCGGGLGTATLVQLVG